MAAQFVNNCAKICQGPQGVSISMCDVSTANVMMVRLHLIIARITNGTPTAESLKVP